MPRRSEQCGDRLEYAAHPGGSPAKRRRTSLSRRRSFIVERGSLSARPSPPVRPNKLKATKTEAMVCCYVDHTAHPLSKDAATRSLKPAGQEGIVRAFTQNAARPSRDPPSTSGSQNGCALQFRRPEHSNCSGRSALWRPLSSSFQNVAQQSAMATSAGSGLQWAPTLVVTVAMEFEWGV